jgi:hypothetical protein
MAIFIGKIVSCPKVGGIREDHTGPVWPERLLSGFLFQGRRMKDASDRIQRGVGVDGRNREK